MDETLLYTLLLYLSRSDRNPYSPTATTTATTTTIRTLKILLYYRWTRITSCCVDHTWTFPSICTHRVKASFCSVFACFLCLGLVHTSGKIHILATPRPRTFLKTSFPWTIRYGLRSALWCNKDLIWLQSKYTLACETYPLAKRADLRTILFLSFVALL